jgi:hypothetical protein
VISGGSQTAGGAERFDQAWHALKADPSVQSNLTLPPPDPKPPEWLRDLLNWLGKGLEPIGRFFRWLFSFVPDAAWAQILLWSVIGLGAAVLLWVLYNRLKHGKWTLRPQRSAILADADLEEGWVPEEAGARSWLEEADALARQGRFADAIHHLLFRSVEDIARRRPALVRPALTSRELAAAEGIPSKARDLFSRIARLVERSLFGGRPVTETDWVTAREAYSDFALASAWRS